tara:strand:+ start:5132 stop:6274 length:1143 start_codon:yes stop_codon:yes gene_type:complete
MYIEFNYLKNFTCVAENCVNTCCSGWDIHIDEKTLNTITETNNNDVKRFFSKKIKPSSNKNFPAQIAIDKKKRCTFLDSNNLCKIQKKIDQRYLSHTCKTYPRREVLFPEVKFLSGSFGCPEITNISLFSEKLLSFKINNTQKTDQPIKLIDEKKFNSFDPEIQYVRNAEKILNFIYDLFLKKENIKVILLFVFKVIKDRQRLEVNSKKFNKLLTLFLYSIKEKNPQKKIQSTNFQFQVLKGLLNNYKDNLTDPLKKIINKQSRYFEENRGKDIYTKKKILLDNFLKNHPLLEENFFLNEIFGKLHFFTNRDINAQNMLIKTILIYLFTKFFFTINTSTNTKQMKREFSKILSYCTRCFEGLEVKKDYNDKLFFTLISLI